MDIELLKGGPLGIMSEEKRGFNDIDVTQYDRMSIEELEEILRQDAVFGDSNETNLNELVYIMSLIADKNRVENPDANIDIEEAKKSFDENYRPIAERGESLFEEEASEPEAMIQSGTHRRFFRTAIAIAAVVALLLAGSLVASALGFNVWDHVADWTHEVFGFGEKYEADERLFEFEIILEKDGIDNIILPTYIPEGYEVVSVDEFSDSAYDKYQCELSNGNDSIIIEYLIGDNESRQYEKDGLEPEIIKINNIEFFFVCNEENQYVSWINENVEGTIFYTDSGLDIERIIKSIQGEK